MFNNTDNIILTIYRLNMVVWRTYNVENPEISTMTSLNWHGPHVRGTEIQPTNVGQTLYVGFNCTSITHDRSGWVPFVGPIISLELYRLGGTLFIRCWSLERHKVWQPHRPIGSTVGYKPVSPRIQHQITKMGDFTSGADHGLHGTKENHWRDCRNR